MPSKGRWPSVSVVIVNYNGRHLLPECLSSLESLKYPGEVEIIVVDNNSHDDSCSYIQKHFPKVKLITSPENKGFAGGNNLALSVATGEYLAFVNSDTKVDEHWLKALVEMSIAHPEAGLISSQLLYYTPYIELEIHSSVVSESELIESTDFTPLGVMIEDIVAPDDGLGSKVWYGQGFYELKRGPVSARWTREQAMALLPLPLHRTGKLEYKVTVHGHQIESESLTHFSLDLAGKRRITETVASHEVKQFIFEIDPKKVAQSNLRWLVQNAGNCVMSDGYSRDRGSIVRRTPTELLEFYENRSPYFEKPTELMAVCGGSFLTKRSTVDSLGLFNEDYFMYYEDLDLSLRYWRAGWSILYCPESLVYHKHRATTGKEESVFFLYHLEKNHLLFVFTHFPLQVVIQELIYFFVRLLGTELKTFIFQFRNNLTRLKAWKKKRSARRMATLACIRLSFKFLRNRWKLQSLSQRSRQEWQRMIY